MNFKQKIIFRLFLVLGGFAMILDGMLWVLSFGFYSPSLCLKLSKKRTNWQIYKLKQKRFNEMAWELRNEHNKNQNKII